MAGSNLWKANQEVGRKLMGGLSQGAMDFLKQNKENPVKQGINLALAVSPGGPKEVGGGKLKSIGCPWCKPGQAEGTPDTSNICPNCDKILRNGGAAAQKIVQKAKAFRLQNLKGKLVG